MPFPANYGGVIDVYFKLKALREAGVKTTLHTFVYGSRRRDDRILEVCEAVRYYDRATGIRSQLSTLPYIVKSRQNPELLSRLLADDAPVLLEGLHCCGFIGRLRDADKKVAVRIHNVEHDYYRALALKSPQPVRRLYFDIESRRLRRYEHRLADADILLTISDADTHHYRRLFPTKNVVNVNPFFDDTDSAATGQGKAPELLYHGNMSVEENIQAVNFLLDSVIPLTASRPKLTVAGHNAPDALRLRGADVIADPSDAELDSLVANAVVNILVTDQPTGMKLKLMKALGKARGYCLVNPPMITDGALAGYCTVADGAVRLAEEIDRMVAHPRSLDESGDARRRFLAAYGTAAGAQKIIKAIF